MQVFVKGNVPAWPMAMKFCTSADCGRSGPMVSLHRHKEQVKVYYSLLQPSTTLPVTSCFVTKTCTIFVLEGQSYGTLQRTCCCMYPCTV